ncbi:MAG: polyprenol monophosphomannose synthase [Candidatus Omnitrophica bacterium]|nr:polyprenol monophosphomannose synthase [Candidatus Omnitrophota bacterium]
MDQFNQRITLVIPTYNEATNIEDLCGLLVEVLSNNEINFEIIIVDDNSPDQTWKIAQAIAKKEKRIKVIRRINKRGLASAVVAGWERASGNILGVMDGDLQQPPEVIPLLINKLNEDVSIDVVVGSRKTKGAGVLRRGLWRRFVSWLGTLISTFLLPGLLAKVSDPMSGFFILRKEVIAGKMLTPLGYKILLEVLAKGTYAKVAEVPYIFQERKRGGSKAGFKEYLLSFVYFLRLSMQTKEGLKIVK